MEHSYDSGKGFHLNDHIYLKEKQALMIMLTSADSLSSLQREKSMQISGIDLMVYSVPVITSNMYVLVSEESALIIDPQINKQALMYLENKKVRDIKAILTHEHYDHISGVNFFRDYAVGNDVHYTVFAGTRCADALPYPNKNMSKYLEALFINKAEEDRRLASEIFDSDYSCKADVRVIDGDELKWSDLKLVFRETPGHSPGSICIELYNERDEHVALVTGDSLVQGNKVVTRLPGGNKHDYEEITRPYLETISPDTLVLPGHGNVSMMGELELG